MYKWLSGLTIIIVLFLFCNKAYCQKDVDFHLIKKFFTGKNIFGKSYTIGDAVPNCFI